jgi:hypothetical protein
MRVQLLFGIVAFGAALHLNPRAVAQAPPENWLTPLHKLAVKRDPGAIALIEASLSVMNPLGKPPITDLALNGDVTQWFGKDASGEFEESAIGLSTELISIRVDGTIAYESFRTAGKANHQASKDIPLSLVNRRPIEQIPHLPQPLLQEVLRNDLDDVELIAEDPEDSTISCVRVVLRPTDWQPYMRDLKSASFDLYISKQTHLLSKVRGLNHFDGTPHHVMPSELLFTDYRVEQGYLVPHSFEERYLGKSMNRFSARSIALNQGQHPGSLN